MIYDLNNHKVDVNILKADMSILNNHPTTVHTVGLYRHSNLCLTSDLCLLCLQV